MPTFRTSSVSVIPSADCSRSPRKLRYPIPLPRLQNRDDPKCKCRLEIRGSMAPLSMSGNLLPGQSANRKLGPDYSPQACHWPGPDRMKRNTHRVMFLGSRLPAHGATVEQRWTSVAGSVFMREAQVWYSSHPIGRSRKREIVVGILFELPKPCFFDIWVARGV
jgi:hypothetical protein